MSQKKGVNSPRTLVEIIFCEYNCYGVQHVHQRVRLSMLLLGVFIIAMVIFQISVLINSLVLDVGNCVKAKPKSIMMLTADFGQDPIQKIFHKFRVKKEHTRTDVAHGTK